MKFCYILCVLLSAQYSFAQDTVYSALIRQLAVVYEDDQRYRQDMESVYARYGWDSPEYRKLSQDMHTADSVNLVYVERILRTYGWLGPNDIGSDGNDAIWAVIQHADEKTQMRYLPMLRDAVEQKRATPQQLALLEDRLALKQGRKQLYGSQVRWNLKTNSYAVLPLEDPDYVDERRREIGLEPMNDYLSHIDMTWDPEQYKKEVLAMDEMYALVCDSIPVLNKELISFVDSRMGKKVKTGQCWDLAAEALNHTKASWDGLYEFGREINPETECVFPGDIIQFEGVEVRYEKDGLHILETMSHHTAFIYTVHNQHAFSLAHQNFGSKRKKVGITELNLDHITKGRFRIFRPQPK